MKLTEHFVIQEFLLSEIAERKGLDNQPPYQHRVNIINILAPGMQRIRYALGHPVQITSGYRSDKVNRAVGGSENSDHRLGLAADFVCHGFGKPKEIAQHLATMVDVIRFAQLIHEGRWVHVSFPALGETPRGEVLTAHFAPGQPPTYTRGIA